MLILFLGITITVFAFINGLGLAVSFGIMMTSFMMCVFFQMYSLNIGGQNLLVQISVPAGASRNALPLILDDGDLTIFKLLLEHGKLDAKR